MDSLHPALGYLLLAFGFGFVIFWHELGHFLAAKYVGIKVDQFAVGFGQALIAWRKGIGLSFGTTAPKVAKAVAAERRRMEAAVSTSSIGEAQTPPKETDDQIAQRLGISETEYRWNWIPLGGYVKMLGQDDMDPNATSPDPRSFNRKSIGARMLVVSAGVLMNIFLAMIGFAVVFALGLKGQPPVVGQAQPGSPAQKAGLEAGDRIAHINGGYQHNFFNMAADVMLAGEGEELKLNVQKADGRYVDVVATPARTPGDSKGFLVLGIEPARELVGLKDTPRNREKFAAAEEAAGAAVKDRFFLRPGERITSINGLVLEQPPTDDEVAADKSIRDRALELKRKNWALFDQAVQQSAGKPVKVTVVNSAGQERAAEIKPTFAPGFTHDSPRLAGMGLRSGIMMVMKGSPVEGKMKAGDVIVEISPANPAAAAVQTPVREKVIATLTAAGSAGDKVNFKVERDGQIVSIPDVQLARLSKTRYGINVQLREESDSTVVGTVEKNSAADLAGIPRGATITRVNGQPVANWFEIKEALAKVSAGQTVSIQAKEGDYTLPPMSATDLAAVRAIRYDIPADLENMTFLRQTGNPLQAANWGVVETKNLLIQTYISLHRLIVGSVPASGMMGPVGIFHAGGTFAERGLVWLLWFLAMISANLAVVNFLPIPIVDGGLFAFLILEKIRGRPLSQRAQAIAQYAGLALLGSVFLFATWQDISRMIWGMG